MISFEGDAATARDTYLFVNTTSLSIVLKSVIRLQGNEPSATQIGVEEASYDASTEVDSDAVYPSGITYKGIRKQRYTK